MNRSKRLLAFAAVLLFISIVQVQADDKGSAWDALVRDDPSIADDGSITEDERLLLEDLSPEEAEVYLAGGATRAAPAARTDPQNLDVGSSSVALGSGALANHTTGPHNVAVGYDALYTLMTGTSNTALGRSALRLTNGFRNTAVGQTAMRNHTSGGHNTAVGDNAQRNNLTGSSNTTVGAQAMLLNLGQNNTAVGAFALRSATTGFNNTVLGRRAGVAITTGSNNIMIGNEGTAGDSGIIRIGTSSLHTATYVAGVPLSMSRGVGGYQNVVINSSGRLSTAASVNGANCDAGNAPLGVDETGAAEGCFDVATQIELDAVTPTNGANCDAGNAPLGVDETGAAEGCFDVATQAELDALGGGGGAPTVTRTFCDAQPSGFPASFTCDCPAGQVLVGGGAQCSVGQLGQDYPLDTDTWRSVCGSGFVAGKVFGISILCIPEP